MHLNNKTVAILGTGRMGLALAKGLTNGRGKLQIIATDIMEDRRRIAKEYGFIATEDNRSAVKDADVVIIAVKPHHVKTLCQDIYDVLNSKQLIISIAAGVKLDYLKKNLPTLRIVRVMPNIAAMVRQAQTAISCTEDVSQQDLETVKSIFSTVGECIVVDESQMDLMTAVIGSGPGFIAAVAEAFVEAGTRMGLDIETATKITNRVLLGSASMMLETKTSPLALKGTVATPGGTTMAGLEELEKAGFKDTIAKVIEAATARAGAISRELSSQ